MKTKLFLLILFFVTVSLILVSDVNIIGFVSHPNNIALNIDIPAEDITFIKKEKIPVNINIYQLDNSVRKDIYLLIYLENEFKERELLEHQTISLETSSSTFVYLDIPEYIELGRYNVIVELKELDSSKITAKAMHKLIITSEELFVPINESYRELSKKILLIIILMMILYIIYLKKYKNKF